MKNVLVVTSLFPRSVKDDVTGYFVYELAKEVMAKGNQVSVLSPHQAGSHRAEEMGGLTVFRFPYFYPFRHERVAYRGGMVYNLRTDLLAKIQLPLFVLSELGHAWYLARKKKIEVIHSHWFIPQGLVGAVLRKVYRIPHIATIHAAEIFALKHLPLKRFLTEFVATNSDDIFIVSTYVSEKMLSMISPFVRDEIRKKIHILPMGIHTATYQGGPGPVQLKAQYGIPTRYVLLFIGRLAEKKGIPYLIRAMPKVVERFGDISLLICGDGPKRKEMEDLVRSLSLDSVVKFQGFITNVQKADFLRLADILIVPSIIQESGETEGLPVVLLEGLAAGKPVIASNVSGARDAIRDGYNGILVEEKNSSTITENILYLLENPPMRETIMHHAAASSQNYDWSAIGEQYAVVIHRLPTP